MTWGGLDWRNLMRRWGYTERDPDDSTQIQTIYDLHPIVPRYRVRTKARFSVKRARYLRRPENRIFAKHWDEYFTDLSAICTPRTPLSEHVLSLGEMPLSNALLTSDQLDQGEAGDNVGLLLRGVEKTEIERGMVLAKKGSITPHTQFEAEVYVLTKEEGGRHTPFFKGYRPQFYFRTTDVTGVVKLPEGVEMVMPGDNVAMVINLITPIAMDEGLRFAIREGGRTVGAGVVAKITA